MINFKENRTMPDKISHSGTFTKRNLEKNWKGKVRIHWSTSQLLKGREVVKTELLAVSSFRFGFCWKAFKEMEQTTWENQLETSSCWQLFHHPGNMICRKLLSAVCFGMMQAAWWYHIWKLFWLIECLFHCPIPPPHSSQQALVC